VTVSDEAILQAIGEVAKGAGVFGEPAAVTAFAGLKKAVFENKIPKDGVVVVLITGNGLKDVAAAMKKVGEPRLISPEPKALETLFGSST